MWQSHWNKFLPRRLYLQCLFILTDSKKLLYNHLSIIKMLLLCQLQLKRGKLTVAPILGIRYFTADLMEEILNLWSDILEKRYLQKLAILHKNKFYEERGCICLTRKTQVWDVCWIKRHCFLWSSNFNFLSLYAFLHVTFRNRKALCFHGSCVVVTVKVVFQVTTVVRLILWSWCSHSWQSRLDFHSYEINFCSIWDSCWVNKVIYSLNFPYSCCKSNYSGCL